MADEQRPDGKMKEDAIASQLQIHVNTILNIRKTYVKQGIEAVIHRKKRMTPPVPPKVTGELEARIIALSCIKELSDELAEWKQARNSSQKGVDWQFTTDDARIKLKRLYPQFKD